MKQLTTLSVALIAFGLAPLAQAANYQPIFERFTPAKSWNWNTVKNMPLATGSNSLSKDQNVKGRYYLERSLDGTSRVTAYGSQAAPNTLVFYSGGWGTNDTISLIQLSDVVNPANLTKVRSNCNFGKISDSYTGKDSRGNRFNGSNYIDYQNIYKWNRSGSAPLYVVEQRGGGWMNGSNSNSGINSSIIITPSLSQLKTAMVQHGWHKNSAGKLVSCSFS